MKEKIDKLYYDQEHLSPELPVREDTDWEENS